MGYRSDVAFAIKTSVTIPDDINQAINETFHDVYTPDDYNIYTADSVKCYAWIDSSYAKFTDFMSSLEQEDFFFIRIGEDDDDVESRGALELPDGYIGYERHIVIPSIDIIGKPKRICRHP